MAQGKMFEKMTDEWLRWHLRKLRETKEKVPHPDKGRIKVIKMLSEELRNRLGIKEVT